MKTFVSISAIMVVVLIASAANATVLINASTDNGSFESPGPVGPGYHTNYSAGVNVYSYANASITGWSADGSSHVVDLQTPGTLTTNVTGNQFAVLSDPVLWGDGLTTTLGVKYQANTQYTLTADIGSNNNTLGCDAYAYLRAVDGSGSTIAGTYQQIDSVITAHDVMTPMPTFVLNTAANPAYVGGYIQVHFGFGGGGTTPYGDQFFIDNVQLTATPEPGTLVLVVVGLVGLLAYAWRKRR